MHSQFGKIKREYLLRAIISGIVGGLCIGLAVTGGTMLALKLCKIGWAWYFYLALGAGCAIVSGVVIFACLLISDKKLAKKLDKKYNLDEKTQTMVEYAESGGVMLELQRADAEAALKALPGRKVKAWALLLKIAAIVLSVAIFVTGIAVPLRTDPIEPAVEEPPYTVDESKLERLLALIENVKGDTILQSDVGEAYVEELEGLYALLTADGLTEALVTGYVQDSMYAVSDITIADTTYDDIAYALTVADSAVYIAESLRESASIYTEINNTLSLYSTLSAVNEKLFSAIADKMDAASEEFTAELKAMTDDTVKDTLQPYISAMESAFLDDDLSVYYNALFTEGGVSMGGSRGSVSSGDRLYDALYDLYYSVKRNYDRYGTITKDADTVISDLAGSGVSAISTFASEAVYAMEVQAYTYMADVYVRETLGSIFGVTVVGRDIEDGSAQEEGDGAENQGGATGGTGEAVYPGDDKLYNPEAADYSYYYEMLQNYGYLGALQELLYSDDVSDEVKSFISAYIQNLLSGN